MPTKEELDKGFRLGEWEVIPSRRMLRRGEDEVTPEPKVFGVLMSLALRNPKARVHPELRFVDSGHVLTTGGVSAGIDMSLWLVGQIFEPDGWYHLVPEQPGSRDPALAGDDGVIPVN